jgi:beta-glucanase (GH16 family)
MFNRKLRYLPMLATGLFWLLVPELAAHGQTAASASRLDRSTLRLTFEENFDEFRRFGEEKGRWRTVFGSGGPRALSNRTLTNNKELQIYVEPEFAGSGGTAPLGLNPFSLSDGILTIEAKPIEDQKIRDLLWGYRYTSGLITSKFSFSQIYGYFEFRAKLPRGRGLWPAFWLVPVDGSWPPELDVMELLGHDPTTYVVTAHSRAGGTHARTGKAVKIPDASAEFHTYGLRWEPGELRWYFDDVEVARERTPADMHKPMYMLVNLAVGGTWPGNPDASTHFPARLMVDFVRAYRIENGASEAGAERR